MGDILPLSTKQPDSTPAKTLLDAGPMMGVVGEFSAVDPGHVLTSKILITERGDLVTRACLLGGRMNITPPGGSDRAVVRPRWMIDEIR
ncbi:hypothetical protein [Saccharopolyspora spinosa]|uniref:hypothetical protein n=1 Tax=Saccharopolyspora spinosa TaxID=60894 RepID=UPI0002379F97|nr:hypothetical protein [Saccharopolyspora spinosa]